MRRVLITGSRDWCDIEPIGDLLRDLIPESDIVILGDCPRGADAIAFNVARQLGLSVEVYDALWNVDGRAAGPKRNQRMVDEGKPTEAHAFPTERSRGTWDCVRRCKAAGVPVTIHE